MLKRLAIKNYALLRELELELGTGMCVITGETGAGKSIMLGAIGLLTGNRADVKVLFDEDQKCIVEGQFVVESAELKQVFADHELDFETETIIRREIAPSGKSRAFINDTPVTLDILKEIGSYLLDIHSQHDTLLLASASYQLALLDAVAGSHELLASYKQSFSSYKQAQGILDTLEKQIADDAANLDFIRYQYQQLESMQLIADEEQEIEANLTVLEHAEELHQRLTQATMFLTDDERNIVSLLKATVGQLDKIRTYLPEIDALHSRLEQVLPEVKDIAAELESIESTIEADPQKQDELNGRLVELKSLFKKFQANSSAELLAIKDELSARLGQTENQEAALDAAKAQLAKALKELQTIAAALTGTRQTAAQQFSAVINRLLAEVALPQARFSIGISPAKLSSTGQDQVSFLFSANKGMEPRAIGQVASGGEFSRLMLCVKHAMAAFTSMPTIIFDEIDTGISGDVALKVGKLVSQMAQKHQLIVITHLPQMAAFADSHYYVFKDHTQERTTSSIRLLTSNERLEELAQIMTGSATDQAVKSAKELLANVKQQSILVN